MSDPVFVPCLVAHWAETAPDGIALRCEAGQVTWAEWDERIANWEGALGKAGVGHGTRVGLCLPPGEQLLSLLIAIFRRGAVACPVNPQFPEAYRVGLLARLDCTLVVDGDEPARVWNEIVSAADSTPPQTEGTSKVGVVAKNENRSPGLGSGFTLLVPPAGEGGGGVKPDVWSLDQPATIIFTSGSTGDPKAAVLSLGNHLESARRSNANIPLTPEDTWLLSLPMHHVAGFGVLFRCLAAGATIALPTPDVPLADGLSSLGVTHVSLVARQLAQLLDGDARLDRLKAILLGGSAIPLPLIDRAVASRLRIHTSYGMTETASQIAATPPGATRAQLVSSGRPLAADTVRIDEGGRIQVNGPTRFLGYWRDDALQCPFDDAGWFTTSDCGYLDDGGFLHVTGRKDNVFIAGGENIQPEEIERALCTLPGIAQAIVVPVPHPEFGATPVAFVECEGTINEDSLRDALVEVLPRFKVPRHILPWPSELADGGMKISRAALTEKAAAWGGTAADSPR